MGFVEITGKVDVFQYWPDGASDVDTVKFVPDLVSATYVSESGSVPVGVFFEEGGIFQPDDNNPGEEKFRSILRKSGGISFSVRLQGIDAPETHYAPNFREGMFDGDYSKWIAKHVCRQKSHRQPYGKLCTDKFAQKIREALAVATPTSHDLRFFVDAKLKIFADGINGAVDVFGRVVGYVTVSGNGAQVVLNDLALSGGFAFCSFYGSMTVDEMNRLTALYANHAAGHPDEKSALRRNISLQLRDFEPELWTTRSIRDDVRDDNGADSIPSKCFDPKLFRRCVDWSGRREALNEPLLLLDYMRSNDEDVVHLSDFIAANGSWEAARKIRMGTLIGKDGAFQYKPGEVVFEARPVEVVNDQRQPLPASFLSPFP